MGIIYKITNQLNSMVYIGQTTRTLKKRMQEHLYNSVNPQYKSYIDRAIGKYGIDAFDVSVIEECETAEELKEREIFWIAFYNCQSPNGYNITAGGDGTVGRIVSEETRQKLSQANKGRKNPISPETRQKMIASRLANKKPVSAETRAKISQANKGKKLSPEICAQMSARCKTKRAVVCLETGQIFESIAAAVKWANVARVAVFQVLLMAKGQGQAAITGQMPVFTMIKLNLYLLELLSTLCVALKLMRFLNLYLPPPNLQMPLKVIYNVFLTKVIVLQAVFTGWIQISTLQ